MILKMKYAATLLILTICLSGCAVNPPITVVSRECLFAEALRWTELQAEILYECCPELAVQMLTHNRQIRELCP